MRVVIVGAGLAGSRCAESLRAAGFEGEVLLLGEEEHPPYERPALSKELLAGTREDPALRPPGWWAGRGIDLRLGRRVTRADLDALRPDALVLATGARARRLPGQPAGVHVLRTLDDARALRSRLGPGRRLVVVGAGFVGLEAASTALDLRCEVTVVEAAAAPLERALGPEVGRLLAGRARARGVDLRLGARVAGLAPDRVELAGGSVLPADAVLVGVGAAPAGELAGGDGAVQTDACGRTAVPGTYACGDVAAWHRPSLGRPVRVEHWTSAAGQASAVAAAILGEPRPYDEPPYFWSDQLGLRLQHVGHGEGWACVRVEGAEGAFVARYLDRRGRLVAALAANRPELVGPLRRELAEAALPLAA